MPNKKKYELEVAAEKLLDEIRKSIKKATRFFFVVPRSKDDKVIYIIESLSWLLLTFALFWRLLEK